MLHVLAEIDSVTGTQNCHVPYFQKLVRGKEYVSVSINICPWQDPMQLGIKVSQDSPNDRPD